MLHHHLNITPIIFGSWDTWKFDWQNYLKLGGKKSSWEVTTRQLAQEKSEILYGLVSSNMTFR